MIQIDRVRTHVDVVGNRPQEAPLPVQPPQTSVMDPVSREQFRALMLEVLSEHLRDLERQGLA